MYENEKARVTKAFAWVANARYDRIERGKNTSTHRLGRACSRKVLHCWIYCFVGGAVTFLEQRAWYTDHAASFAQFRLVV
jgi:hypothetical protein